MAEDVEVGAPHRPRLRLHPRFDRRAVEAEPGRHLAPAGRLAVAPVEVLAQPGRPAAGDVDLHPQADRLDPRAPVAGDGRAPLGPAPPGAGAERRQRQSLAEHGRHLDGDHRAPHDPAHRVAEPGVDGVVVGDVLQVARHRVEAQLAGRVGVAQAHRRPSRRSGGRSAAAAPARRPARRSLWTRPAVSRRSSATGRSGRRPFVVRVRGRRGAGPTPRGSAMTRKIVESTFVSLDGVISDPQNWSPPYWDDEHSAYAATLLGPAEALLLGRATYEGFAAAVAATLRRPLHRQDERDAEVRRLAHADVGHLEHERPRRRRRRRRRRIEGPGRRRPVEVRHRRVLPRPCSRASSSTSTTSGSSRSSSAPAPACSRAST